MFSEEQEKLRLEKEAATKRGTQIYSTVLPSAYETSYKETEAAPSEEKGLFTSAKDAIVSAVSEGIESVKELIHDVKASLEPEEEATSKIVTKERQNPESPLTKEPILAHIPYTSTIRRTHRLYPKRKEQKLKAKTWTQKIREAFVKTLPTEEETPLKEKK